MHRLMIIILCSWLSLPGELHAQPMSSEEAEISFFELENDYLVITPSKMKQKASDAPATIMVITAEQIIARGYLELDDALRDIPGLDMVHVHGAFPTVRAMRGSYGDENRRLLLMVDGIVENSIMGGFEMGGPAYSLHNAERIEVIWGPASALYGANAFSGVINVITKQGEKHQGFEYQRGFGSFNTAFDRFSLITSRGAFDLAVSGGLFRTDGPRFTRRHPLFSDAYVDNAYSLVGRFTRRGRNHTATFGFHTFNTPMGDGTFGNSPTKILGLPDMGQQNQGTQGWLNFDFNNGRPSLWHPYTRTIFLQTDLRLREKYKLTGQAQYRETGVAEDTFAYLYIVDRFNKLHLAHHSNRMGLELQLDCAINTRQTLTTGVQYSQDNLERDYRRAQPDTELHLIQGIPVTNLNAVFLPRLFTVQHNIGAYAQYILRTDWLKSTALTLGSRYDYNSIYGATFNPRAGLVIRPRSRWTIKLLYGSAFRAPTNFELYNTGPTRIPNPGLKPEKERTVEVGLEYRQKYAQLEVVFFDNRLSDLITGDVPVSPTKTQIQNAGTAAMTGFELKCQAQPAKRIRCFANFSFQDAQEERLGKTLDVPNVARLKGNIGLQYELEKLLTLDVIENWVGERSVAVTNPLGKVGGYWLTHLSMTTQRLFAEHFSLNITIRNLFDQTYYDPGIRAADGLRPATTHDQPGLTAFVKVSGHF